MDQAVTISASQQISFLWKCKHLRFVQTRALRKINNSNLLNGSEFGIVSQCEQIGCSKRSDNTTFILMEPPGTIFFFFRKTSTKPELQLRVTLHSSSFLGDFWIGADINSLPVQNNAATRLFFSHCVTETWLANFANSANWVAKNTYQVENPFEKLNLVDAASEVHMFYRTRKFIITYTTAWRWSCPEREDSFHTAIFY